MSLNFSLGLSVLLVLFSVINIQCGKSSRKKKGDEGPTPQTTQGNSQIKKDKEESKKSKSFFFDSSKHLLYLQGEGFDSFSYLNFSSFPQKGLVMTSVYVG